jgi:cell filamentation protein
MTDDPYVYPGTSVLRNKFGIRDAAELDEVERLWTRQRAFEGVPKGDFDLPHLQAIHAHLFQDVYRWAGEIRTIEISKGGNLFMFCQFVENGMADVHRRVIAANYLKDKPLDIFADDLAHIIGDVNYVHPFREGNGRTQMLYLQQLCGVAAHALDLRCIDREGWLEGSRRAHEPDYGPLSKTLRAALKRSAASNEPPRNASDYLRERSHESETAKDSTNQTKKRERSPYRDR